jgi:hypothetical protein
MSQWGIRRTSFAHSVIELKLLLTIKLLTIKLLSETDEKAEKNDASALNKSVFHEEREGISVIIMMVMQMKLSLSLLFNSRTVLSSLSWMF